MGCEWLKCKPEILRVKLRRIRMKDAGFWVKAERRVIEND